MRSVALMLVVASLGGCRCSAPPPEAEAPPLPHYAEWDGLVRAATRGDLETARVIARDLTGGPAAEAPEGQDGLARAHGALAFVGFAEDPAELAETVATVASGCGGCHVAARAVPNAPRPAWTHHSAADWAIWGILWGEPVDAVGSIAPAGLGEAWSAPVRADTATNVEPSTLRASRLLAACAACHAPP